MPACVELLPEVSEWVTGLTPAALKQALERGATWLLDTDELRLHGDARDYVEGQVEYAALAAQALHLEHEQQELEQQEHELEALAETLAAGRVKGWGVREHSKLAGAEPKGPRADSTTVPRLILTPVRFDEPDTVAYIQATLRELCQQKGWDEAVALRNALTCAFALGRLASLDRNQLAKERAVLGRQCAVLRYRIWVLSQDNRTIEMHLGGLRARVARLRAMPNLPPTQTR
ncbi:MAG: hypothetical protein AB1446_02315 [Bacillota bacterium]